MPAQQIELAKDLIRVCRKEMPSANDGVSLLSCLQVIGKVELISQFLDIMSSLSMDYFFSTSFSGIICTIESKHGWGVLKSPLSSMFSKLTSNGIKQYSQFLCDISRNLSSETHKDICRSLAGAVVRELSSQDDSRPITQTKFLT